MLGKQQNSAFPEKKPGFYPLADSPETQETGFLLVGKWENSAKAQKKPGFYPLAESQETQETGFLVVGKQQNSAFPEKKPGFYPLADSHKKPKKPGFFWWGSGKTPLKHRRNPVSIPSPIPTKNPRNRVSSGGEVGKLR